MSQIFSLEEFSPPVREILSRYGLTGDIDYVKVRAFEGYRYEGMLKFNITQEDVDLGVAHEVLADAFAPFTRAIEESPYIREVREEYKARLAESIEERRVLKEENEELQKYKDFYDLYKGLRHESN